MREGKLVSSLLVANLWSKEMEKIKSNQNFPGIIIDGSPRVIFEAKLIDAGLHWYEWDGKLHKWKKKKEKGDVKAIKKDLIRKSKLMKRKGKQISKKGKNVKRVSSAVMFPNDSGRVENLFIFKLRAWTPCPNSRLIYISIY